MKIIKRNGTEAVFDINKIVMAVTKANKAADEKNKHNIASIIAIHNLLEEIITNQSFGG